MTEVPYTPAVVVDLPVVRRNIDMFMAYTRKHGIKVRPHTKTHKSVRIAKMQIAAGMKGLTFAKVGEAEALADVTDDILVAYPVFDEYRRGRLAELAKRKTVRVALDAAYGAEMIGSAAKSAGVTIGVLADIDVGMHRTGVQTPGELVELAKKIDGIAGVRLDGIFCYPGHIKGPDEEKIAGLAPVQAMLAESVELFKKAGLSTEIVSGGSSPTAMVSHYVPAYTEIRPGTNVYNDMNQVWGEVCGVEDCAARVTCTVISVAVPGKFVLDGGSKTFTQDRSGYDPVGHGFGRVVEYSEGVVTRLTEEHAEVEVRGGKTPKLGERVTVVPNHVCPCINLHEAVWYRESDGSLVREVVEGRGKLV
ncbi:MAG TPA: alanine racemase [Tepidisphaeraceae bacterium]|jgi:D-serine deaminase-like pyridoxal phosphate-dependent protein|nr:alanine racemase [Tepidisphaeraceae bacterium]